MHSFILKVSLFANKDKQSNRQRPTKADNKDRIARVERRRTRGEIKHEIEPSSSENTAREQKDKKKKKKREKGGEGADMGRDERLAV